MTLTIKTLVTLLITASLFAIALLVGIAFSTTNQANAAAGQLPATIATTSALTVNTTVSRVFATSSCAARIITTTASPIMIGFTDYQGFIPTALIGHLQAASTTVSYDANMYGCGAVRVYSFVAGTITVSESR